MPKNKSPAKRAAAKSPAKIASVPKVPAAESKAAAEDDKGEASGDQSEYSDEYSDEDVQDRDDAQFEEGANFPNADAADGFGGAGAERFTPTEAVSYAHQRGPVVPQQRPKIQRRS